MKKIMNNHPILSRFIVIIVMPLVIFTVLLITYFIRSLPTHEGEVFIKPLQYSVSIIRSKKGVPQITTQTDRDAFIAIGYLHAQDRLWQMEMQRRLAQGRLSEVLGIDALKTDQLMRTLGLARAAKSAVDHLSVDAINSLKAYADGVNAWLEEDHVLPIEFTMLNFKPEPWQVDDSIALVKLLALNLGGNFNEEIEFNLLVSEIGYQRASELHPSGAWADPESLQFTSLIKPESLQGLFTLNNTLERQFQMGGEGVGSNAWVVSGEHTDSGLPLLANDPHLATQIPSVWYLAEIRSNPLHVVGATLPGIPCVVFGHNQQIAWGGTAMGADVQDLFIERINPRNPNQYEFDGRWLNMTIIEETIHIKPSFPAALRQDIPPVQWQSRSTHHGPVISDVIDKLQYPLSLAWTALLESDRSYQSILSINYAGNWKEFTTALQDYTAPALNFVYADLSGNIGLSASGLVPIRSNGDGRLPVPGWKTAHEWNDYIPFSDMPQQFNPDSGILVNANNQNHTNDYPYIIATSWAQPYRANRITNVIGELLQDNNKISATDFIDLQGDVKNIQSSELLSLLTTLKGQTTRQLKALSLLQQWDGNSNINSVAASIYQTWLRHFNRILLEDDLRGEFQFSQRSDLLQHFIEEPNPQFLKQVVQGKSITDWCDNSLTVADEDCTTAALQALEETLDELDRLAGSKMHKWHWGKIHKTKLPHTVFADMQPLDMVFNRKIHSAGDDYTVNVAASTFSESEGYEQYFGPSYRQVIDLSNWNNSQFINNTGQSGNVFSSHYDDLIAPHQKLELLPMSYGDDINDGKILTLKPTTQP